MSEQKSPPAIMLSKNDEPLIQDLTPDEGFALFKAIYAYGCRNEMPKNFSKHLLACFHSFKKTIDLDVKSYQLKCDREKRAREKRKRDLEEARKILAQQPKQQTKPTTDERTPQPKPKARGKPAREPTKIDQGNLTEVQARFLTRFQELCPDKELNCKLSDYPDVDLNALIIAIKRSPQYLMNPVKTKGFEGLRWYLDNAEKILNNNYRLYEDVKKGKSFELERTSTAEEANSHFQNIDEIEI